MVGLTTDEVRGWLRAIDGSNKRPKTHPQNTTQQGKNLDEPRIQPQNRVAELGSLSLGAKMAMKIFVKCVFTIFA